MEWLARPSGRPGRPEAFSDAAIQFCLSLKVLFGLALRQTIGMVASLLKLAGLEDWPVLDFSTLCRRQKTVTIQISFWRSDGPLNLLVDSTGVKVLGNGEWQVRKHGPSRRRQWRKVHMAMDTATGDVRAVEFTSSREGDSPGATRPAGADPSRPAHRDHHRRGRLRHSSLSHRDCRRGATAIIPIRRNGRAWRKDSPAARARNETLRTTQRFGRALWKRLTGDHARSRAEAKMLCLKSFGERIASRDPDRQTAEIHARVALMNRFAALGRAEIVRVA